MQVGDVAARAARSVAFRVLLAACAVLLCVLAYLRRDAVPAPDTGLVAPMAGPPGAPSPWPMRHHDARGTSQSPATGTHRLGRVAEYRPKGPPMTTTIRGLVGGPVIGQGGGLICIGPPMGGAVALSPRLTPLGSVSWAVLGANRGAGPVVREDGAVITVGDQKPAILDGNFTLAGTWEPAPSEPRCIVPTPDGGLVAACDNGDVCAWSPDGRLRWHVAAEAEPQRAIAVAPDGRILVAGRARVRSLSPDGAVEWTSEAPGGVSAGPVVADDGSVLVGCRDRTVSRMGPDGPPVALARTGISPTALALAYDGRIIIGSDRLDALSPDGSLATVVPPMGGVVECLALDAAGAIYATWGSQVTAWAADGQKLWGRDLGQELGRPVHALDLAVGDGAIYAMASDAHVYGFFERGR